MIYHPVDGGLQYPRQPEGKYHIATCGITFVITFCVLAFLGYSLIKQAELFLKEQNQVNWVLDHKYPSSIAQTAEAEIGAMPTDDNLAITVVVTFISPDSFEKIMNWYTLHP